MIDTSSLNFNLGVAFGALVLVIIILALILWILKKRRSSGGTAFAPLVDFYGVAFVNLQPAMGESREETECDTCEKPILGSPAGCLCSGVYCEDCFHKHIRQMERKGRGDEHGQAETWEPSVADMIWGKVSKAIAEIDLSTLFIEDEKAK
ncbi:hypothetical protein TWF751_004797 [Orbilia oligospora]|nr:hypothetical protein TWF751_004797 [Orbilia oligospora]